MALLSLQYKSQLILLYHNQHDPYPYPHACISSLSLTLVSFTLSWENEIDWWIWWLRITEPLAALSASRAVLTALAMSGRGCKTIIDSMFVCLGQRSPLPN